MGQCWTKESSVYPFPTKANFMYFCYKRGTHDDSTMPELVGGNVHLITAKEMWEKETSEANKEGKTVVVNFSASWCSPCRQIAPAYRELADKYTSILFLTVDVEKLAEFSTSWDIKATPTFFFLRDGRELGKLVGAKKRSFKRRSRSLPSQIQAPRVEF